MTELTEASKRLLNRAHEDWPCLIVAELKDALVAIEAEAVAQARPEIEREAREAAGRIECPDCEGTGVLYRGSHHVPCLASDGSGERPTPYVIDCPGHFSKMVADGDHDARIAAEAVAPWRELGPLLFALDAAYADYSDEDEHRAVKGIVGWVVDNRALLAQHDSEVTK